VTLLGQNTYHPDVMARTYRVLFFDAKTEDTWRNMVAVRNCEYADYLTPPETAAGTAQWDWSIRTGLMASTIDALNEKWHRTFEAFIATAIEAQKAKRTIESMEPSGYV